MRYVQYQSHITDFRFAPLHSQNVQNVASAPENILSIQMINYSK
jgi:hypothetical protein